MTRIKNKGEKFETLFKNKTITIQRITSPRNFVSKTYVQNVDEWVTLIKGGALIKVDNRKVRLKTGSSVFLPKNVAHQFQISKSSETIWFAVYMHSSKIKS